MTILKDVFFNIHITFFTNKGTYIYLLWSTSCTV